MVSHDNPIHGTVNRTGRRNGRLALVGMVVAPLGPMEIDGARAFFAVLAARGHEPRLANAEGTWQFDIEGAGTWTVTVDHGALRVTEGKRSSSPEKGGEKPMARFGLREDELVRLARGEGHQNLITALIRGALTIDGELAFAQRLQVLVPLPDEWRTTT